VILTHYLIHFINGEVLHVSECKKDDDEMDLADEYIASIPSGILQVGKEGMPQLYIPVENILYISLIPEECAE